MIGAEHSPGMELMTGSLGAGHQSGGRSGHGPQAAGDRGRVFVFMSDGEFQSGQVWEAIQAMAFHRLDNTVIYVDVNGQQCDGLVSQVMNIEPLDKRLKAFGARVIRIDGHDVKALARPAGLKPDGRPLVVLADTDPCRGIELLAGRRPKLHYTRFERETEREAFRSLLDSL
jgi:Transketolase, N-terminal subunit